MKKVVILAALGLLATLTFGWDKPPFPASLYDSVMPENFYANIEPWDSVFYDFCFKSEEGIALTLSLRRIQDHCRDDGYCIITTKTGRLVAVIIDDEPPPAINTSDWGELK